MMNRKFFVSAVLFLAIIFFYNAPALSESHTIPPVPDEQRVREKQGQFVNLELEFIKEDGKKVKLKELFRGKPVLLTLVYYQCPSLCGFMLNSFNRTLKEMDWNVGDEFDVIVISFDWKESHELALAKKKAYLESYKKAHPENTSSEIGWHFLTGTEEDIRNLTNNLGFYFEWNEKEKQWMHSTVLFAVQNDGIIKRYIYGLEFEISDLKMAIYESGGNKIGSWKEKAVFLFYKFNPETRKYYFSYPALTKLIISISFLILGIGFFFYFLQKFKNKE